MPIALMTDIHGNREAFQACLDHAALRGVDRYVFLGDFVGYGADPGWVVDTAMRHVARGAVAVMGNHDAALSRVGQMNDDARAAIAWTRERLDPAQREFLAKLPLEAEDGSRLYVHANAFAPAGWAYVAGPGEAVRSIQACDHHAAFCGHIHVPALYHLAVTGKILGFAPVEGVAVPLLPQRRWLAVIGSVGQPRDGNPAAAYAVLDERRNELTYLRVPYDVDAAARKIRDAGLPPRLALRLYRGR